MILIIGIFINGILSCITFKNKKLRESGCGIYLLNSSIIVLLLMFIFTLKFWILILMQIGTITNELFLKIECRLIDFLLRLCLTMDQWLTAFVSIERAFITVKGLHFDKKKTKLVAKYTICVLLLVTILTNIHDPIHRSLHKENDDDEKNSCVLFSINQLFV
jgi:branched-subunit amino acid transport protein AzlD